MDRMVNYIRLTWKFEYMLRICRTCSSTIGFFKYEFNNKLLSGVTLLKVISDITWTQLKYIYIYIKLNPIIKSPLTSKPSL